MSLLEVWGFYSFKKNDVKKVRAMRMISVFYFMSAGQLLILRKRCIFHMIKDSLSK